MSLRNPGDWTGTDVVSIILVVFLSTFAYKFAGILCSGMDFIIKDVIGELSR
jgi:hypothetical protein